MYQVPVKKVPAFASLIRDGICVLHEGDGVYCVLTNTSVLRRKHVRAMETAFPGLTEVATAHPSNQSYSPIVIDLGSQSDAGRKMSTQLKMIL